MLWLNGRSRKSSSQKRLRSFKPSREPLAFLPRQLAGCEILPAWFQTLTGSSGLFAQARLRDEPPLHGVSNPHGIHSPFSLSDGRSYRICLNVSNPHGIHSPFSHCQCRPMVGPNKVSNPHGIHSPFSPNLVGRPHHLRSGFKPSRDSLAI
jgi:hypothetical protein